MANDELQLVGRYRRVVVGHSLVVGGSATEETTCTCSRMLWLDPWLIVVPTHASRPAKAYLSWRKKWKITVLI